MHSLTEVLDKIKRNASSKSKQGSNNSHAATIASTDNLSTANQIPTRNPSRQQRTSTTEHLNRSRVSCTTSPASSPNNSSPQVMTDHANVQGGGNSHAASHSVEQAHAQNVAAGVVDDASSLGKTEGENAKSERLLQQYFTSLAQSGTVRTVADKKDLITTKLGIIFKQIKFIDSDTELSGQGNIAKVLYKEMPVPENFRNVWWEQVKRHVRKN